MFLSYARIYAHIYDMFLSYVVIYVYIYDMFLSYVVIFVHIYDIFLSYVLIYVNIYMFLSYALIYAHIYDMFLSYVLINAHLNDMFLSYVVYIYDMFSILFWSDWKSCCFVIYHLWLYLRRTYLYCVVAIVLCCREQILMSVRWTLTSVLTACVRTWGGATAASVTWATRPTAAAGTVWVSPPAAETKQNKTKRWVWRSVPVRLCHTDRNPSMFTVLLTLALGWCDHLKMCYRKVVTGTFFFSPERPQCPIKHSLVIK